MCQCKWIWKYAVTVENLSIRRLKKIDKLPFGYYNTSNRVVTNGGYGGKNRWSVQNVVKKWEKDIYSAVRMELSALQMKYREFLRMQKTQRVL